MSGFPICLRKPVSHEQASPLSAQLQDRLGGDMKQGCGQCWWGCPQREL